MEQQWRSKAVAQKASPFNNPQQRPERRENKLYIGNLSPNVSEFNIISLFKPFGTIVREEFVWHKHGPKRGQPRGFCFVEFSTRQEAELAMANLNSKPFIDNRPLAIRWAHEKSENDTTSTSASSSRSGLQPTESNPKPAPTKIGLETRIKAIEMKLQLMDQEEVEEKRKNKNRDHRARPY